MAYFRRLSLLVLALAGLLSTASADDLAKARGIWRSQGYGLALAFEGPDFRLYEYTPMGRFTVAEGNRSALEQKLGKVHLRDGGRRLIVQDATSIAPIAFERVEQLPGPSLNDLAAPYDAGQMFDIVWHTFDGNYAFFELRGVDWQAQRERLRSRIRRDSTESELFEGISTLLGTLGDNHVEIRAEGFAFHQPSALLDTPLVRQWHREHSESKSTVDFFTFARQRYYQYVAASDELIAGQLTPQAQSGANEMLVWGRLPGDIGYLRIREMAGYVADNSAAPAVHLAALATTLDQALEELQDTRAMIVDVRFNGGGWDPAGVLIANRFADQRRAAFTKKARTADGFTPPHTVYVEPAGPRQFTRPTLVLTSPLTASAAEIFTFCMKALPHAKQVGLPTMGIHSDMLVRHLPNGWTFSLSNEVYTFVDGKVYEKLGIPPDVEIPMFEVGDHRDGKDQVLERAMELLTDVSQNKP